MRLFWSKSSCWSRLKSQVLFHVIPAKQKSIRLAHMDGKSNLHRPKHKILVIMGATGTGKTRLSLDIATRIPSEIINADKIQLHRGLDITTNKIPMQERRGIPHHLLGEFDPDRDISPLDYRSIAAATISEITKRRRLPIVVGGSNSFIHALVSGNYDPDAPDFGGSAKLRYNCCFIWVDVERRVLDEYLSRRVDEMLDSGMFEELAEYNNGPGVSGDTTPLLGLRKAIGVPEFERYFRCYRGRGRSEDDLEGRLVYEKAVEEIKENTFELAEKQVGKIQRLRSNGWDMQRVNATESFQAVLESDTERFRVAWERNVLEPSLKTVKRFLEVGANLRTCCDQVPFLSADNF